MIKLSVTVSPLVGEVGGSVSVTVMMSDDGFLADPAALDLTATKPDGSVDVYTWPDPADLEKSSLGVFTLDLDLDVSGKWFLTASVPAEEASARTSFRVEPKAETLVVTALDASSDPIADASVVLALESGGVVGSGLTNADGEATIQVKPGEYVLHLYKPRVSFPTETEVTIPETGGLVVQTAQVDGVVLAITPTTGAVRTRVFGQMVCDDGSPAAHIRVNITTVSRGDVAPFVSPTTAFTGVHGSNLVVAGRRRTVVTDDDGYWEAELVADSDVRVEIPAVGFSKTFRVPRRTSFNIRDAREAPSAD